MRKSNDVTLKEAMQAFLDSSKRIKMKVYQTKVSKIWQQAMGVTITRYTSELKVRNRKLYVVITSAPLREELSYGKEKIKKIVNEELGEAYIEEVVIR